MARRTVVCMSSNTPPSPATPPASERVAPADLTTYYAVHEAMRASNERLVAGIAGAPLGDTKRIAAIAVWLTGYAGELSAHHRSEDEIYFPALGARVPTYADYAGAVAADHGEIDAVIERLVASMSAWRNAPGSAAAKSDAHAAAIDLRDRLDAHLALEDRDVLPLFPRHFDTEEFEALDQRMLASLDKKAALFSVPWFMTSVPEPIAEQLRATAPLVLRVIFRLTRRRYLRLVTTAFGAPS